MGTKGHIITLLQDGVLIISSTDLLNAKSACYQSSSSWW